MALTEVYFCRGFFPNGVNGKINSTKGYDDVAKGTEKWAKDAALAFQVQPALYQLSAFEINRDGCWNRSLLADQMLTAC